MDVTWNVTSNGYSYTPVQKSITTGTAFTRIVEASITTATTDRRLACAMDVSQLKTVWMYATVAMTVETNSGSAADDTIALAAGVPYLWMTGSVDACQFTTDIVTDIYVTNASGSTGDFHLAFEYDGSV